jgi:hypothetical protein
MRTTNPPAGRLVSIVLALVVAAALSLVVTAAPAQAVHQNCGELYPEGTLSNGHPDLSTDHNVGWSGAVSMHEIDTAVFALTSTKDLIMDGAGIASATKELLEAIAADIRKALPDPAELVALAVEAAAAAASVVAIVLVVSGLAVLIGETAAMTVQRLRASDVEGEDACNAVLAGDMLDQVWVATVQRNLASDGPPLAMLLIPTDSSEAGGHSGEWPLQPQHEEEDFGWCPEITLPEKIPTPATETNLDEANGPTDGGDCTPTVFDGFLNEPWDGAPRVTVEAVVEDTIAHARAHGLPVRQADAHLADARAALGAKRYKEAFSHFRLAYQDAAGLDG